MSVQGPCPVWKARGSAILQSSQLESHILELCLGPCDPIKKVQDANSGAQNAMQGIILCFAVASATALLMHFKFAIEVTKALGKGCVF